MIVDTNTCQKRVEIKCQWLFSLLMNVLTDSFLKPKRCLQITSVPKSNYIQCTIILNREKHQMFTPEKQECANVWHCNLIND